MSRVLLWATAVAAVGFLALRVPAGDVKSPASPTLEWAIPNPAWKLPFADDAPITFITRAKLAQWNALPDFWNETTEKVTDPTTGKEITRRAVLIKVPLGLIQPPPVPAENPMTVAKWKLGKKLYFDSILSSDGTVSCATCHDPARGYTDQARFSTGIKNLKGGMSAPTVINSAYHAFQFWDGRAISLEDQAQGPVQNAVEMFDGDGHAWTKTVGRLKGKPEYVAAFRAVFGTDPNRDAAAKAIACYERTVLSGNSLHERAELIMRKRVEDAELTKFELVAGDYEAALKDAFARKDTPALSALGLDVAKDQGKTADVAKSLVNGRNLFHNKARCSLCHTGENWTDNLFHNLGVGVKDGALPADGLGRFAAQPTGHKNYDHIGAFKTPSVRALVHTGPYLHDGSEKTLEDVVELYNKGGIANEFLDPKMRDVDAEAAAAKLLAQGKPAPAGVQLFGDNKKPIVPLKLNLTETEKKDLVLFLRALQGDPIPAIVADPKALPK